MQMIIVPVNSMLLVHGLLLRLSSAAKWLSYAPFKHNLNKVRREREDKGTKSLILEVIWLLVFCFCFFLLKYVHMHKQRAQIIYSFCTIQRYIHWKHPQNFPLTSE